MSKRRRVTVVPQKDKFYQDWCVKQTQSAINASDEWSLDTPKPLYAPPAGRYYTIEVHSIEWYFLQEVRAGQKVSIALSLSYSSRQGKTPFCTQAGDPENLFWVQYVNDDDSGHGEGEHVTNCHTNRAVLTDDHGFGKLVVGDHLYMQLATNQIAHTVPVGLKIQYTFTTVSCSDYVEELAAQLANPS